MNKSWDKDSVLVQVERYIGSLLSKNRLFHQQNLLDKQDIMQIAYEAAIKYMAWAQKRELSIIPKVAINKARFAIFKACKRHSCPLTVPSYKSSQKKIKQYINHINTNKINMDGAQIFLGTFGDAASVDKNDYLDHIDKIARKRLNHRERDIFYNRVLGNKTLREIGRRWGITQERTRQISKIATTKIREILSKKELEFQNRT